MKSILLSVSALALIAASPAHAAQCSAQLFGQTVPFTCPDPVAGPQGEIGAQGPQGEKGDTGAQGAKGDAGATGAAGAQGVVGPAGKDGTNGTNGTNGLNGRDYDMSESIALSSAMSLPVWLGDNEKARISGGVGFSDEGDTAFGVTGVVRLDKNWAAFAGGAVSDGGTAGGRAGLSVGW